MLGSYHSGHYKRGGVRASFFIALILLASTQLAANMGQHPFISADKIEAIAFDPAWMALIHWDGRTPHIIDKKFLLSQGDFSPTKELRLTLELLYSGDTYAACRFPARYYYLKEKLSLPSLNLEACADLLEFKKKAPIDKLYIVFASENISSPASMMGHTLIKISGINDLNISVDHAISFYTNINGFNLPKIFYTSVISGKKGFFTLSPYAEKLAQYNIIEGRNVWEYEIEVDEFTLTLIQYHFFELKQTDLKYFFIGYNCATLTHFILSLASRKIPTKNLFGISPIDVVKSAKKNGLIRNTKLIPAKKWRIKMFEDNLDSTDRKIIASAIINNSLTNLEKIEGDENRFIALNLAENYKDTQFENNAITQLQSESLQNKINNVRKDAMFFDLDLSEYKDPTKSPADSQIAIGGLRYRNENYVILDLLPASHKLEDDNRQYFGETALTLGELSIASSLETKSAFLKSFTLYGVNSLMPRATFGGGLSGRFRIGLEQQIYNDWQQHSQVYVDGALGSTFDLTRDIDLYALFGIQLSSSRFENYISGSPELGLIVNEVFNMKSIFHLERNFSQSREVPDTQIYKLTQCFYLNQNWAVFLQAEKMTIRDRTMDQFSFWIKHYF
jgi:hypothetical protein